MTDTTPPPAPTNLRVSGNERNWEAESDLERDLAGFLIERDGQFLANVPEQSQNPTRVQLGTYSPDFGACIGACTGTDEATE